MKGKFQTTRFVGAWLGRIPRRMCCAVAAALVAVGNASLVFPCEVVPGRLISQERAEKLLSEFDVSDSQAAEAVPILLATLSDSEAETALRERSAQMLARIGEPARAAVPVLAELLRQSTGKSDRASIETAYWTMKSLGRFGRVAASAVSEVAKFLTSPTVPSKLRVLAADTLGQIRSSSAIGVLTSELMKPRRDSDYETIILRQTIIDSLAQAGPMAVGAIPALARSVEDDNPDVRRKVCDALGSLGPRAEGAVGPLFDRLILDDNEAVKDAAANALGQIGMPALEELVSLVEHGGPKLQWRAARSLGQIGRSAEAAVPSLETLFDSQSAQIRIEAVDAVWKISGEPKAVAGRLLKMLAEDDRQIRRRVAGLLVELNELPGDTSAVLGKLASGQGTHESRAAEYVIRERERRHAPQ